jgi:hypothetical protein
MQLWVELSVLIRAEFSWRLVRNPIRRIDVPRPYGDEDAHSLEYGLEMTLKRRMHEDFPRPRRRFNDTNLDDAAFLPKTFTVRLDHGQLPPQGHVSQYSQWYRYRLTFEPSPFPPLDEWKYKSPAKANKFWRWKEFMACALPDHVNKQLSLQALKDERPQDLAGPWAGED